MGLSWIEVDAGRILANVETVRRRLPRSTKLMAVVKANAYGHGAHLVVPLLRGRVDWLGVDSLDEARQARELGAEEPVLVLGHTEARFAEDLIRNDLRQSLFRRDLAEALSRASGRLGREARVHLKVETGLHRLGVPVEEVGSWGAGLTVEGAYTHLADAEDPASTFYRTQLARLDEAVAVLRRAGHDVSLVHGAPTAGALLHPEEGRDLVRVGIGLFGLWPSSEVRAALSDVELLAALSWKSRVAQARTVPEGDTVGYDLTYRAPSERRIAVIPVGYYDGFDRGLSNRGQVLVRGRRAPVVGRVAMNMFMADVTDMGADEGDEVVLLGAQGDDAIGADEMASWIDTIAYEVVARLNPNLPRRLTGQPLDEGDVGRRPVE